MRIVLFCTVPTSFHSLASGMTVFDGSNFSEWYERVQFSLGVLDLNLDLITDKSPEAMDDSTPEQVEQSKAWARFVRPEKFQFLEKRQNRNFDYKIIISVKNP